MTDLSQLTDAFGTLATATQAALTAVSARSAVYVAPGGSIQAAVDVLPAAGGTVQLGVGDYPIPTAIVPRGHVVFRGAGRDATVIQASGCGGFEYTPAVGNAGTTDWWMTWLDLTIRGDYTAGKDGIHLKRGTANAAHYSVAERVRIERFARHGTYLEQDVYGFTLRDSEIKDCDGDGIWARGQSNATRIETSRFTRNNGAAIRIGGPGFVNYGASIRDNVIEQNRDGGILADWSLGLEISGNYFEANALSFATPAGRTDPGAPTVGRGIWLGTQGTSWVRGVSITGNLFALAKGAAATGYHIVLGDGASAGANGIHYAGNSFDENCTRAILNTANTLDVVVSPANWYNAPTDRALTRGYGVFAGTVGNVITHNFGTTNYRLAITPTAALAGRWYVTKTANSFRVRSTDAADVGTFDWLILQES